MPNSPPTFRVGIYGSEESLTLQHRGCGLWSPGYSSAVTAAGGTPVPLRLRPGCSWDELLDRVHAVLFTGNPEQTPQHQADGERLCQWCQELRLPLLAIDEGMHILNTTYGGTLYTDLVRELPSALQHQHPPEEGIRHAINVIANTRLSRIYGEGEIVVNSKHRQALSKIARGFRVSAQALDGVVEAIEPDLEGWFALGVQWRPAAASASGLDIQLFRGLVDACGTPRKRRRERAGEFVAA
jgi:putative glutamine amidotransferase